MSNLPAEQLPICVEARRVAISHEKNGERRTANLLRGLADTLDQCVDEANHLRSQIPNVPQDDVPATCRLVTSPAQLLGTCTACGRSFECGSVTRTPPP